MQNKEEKSLFHGSKDGAGRILKVKWIIEVNRDIKLTSTQRQHLTCIATIILKYKKYLVRGEFLKLLQQFRLSNCTSVRDDYKKCSLSFSKIICVSATFQRLNTGCLRVTPRTCHFFHYA